MLPSFKLKYKKCALRFGLFSDNKYFINYTLKSFPKKDERF